MKTKPVVHLGQPSWHLAKGSVEAWVTQTGGHLAPAQFRLKGKTVSPLHVTPWHSEDLPASTPPILRVLRGDFFCLPFGMNELPYKNEKHPVHGESANRRWQLKGISEADNRLTAEFDLQTKVRAGKIRKVIELRGGDSAIYQHHIISGMSGPMNYGHHATLHFKSEGRLSFSPFQHGQVYPGQFENPVAGGYSCLKAGATFRSLNRVPLAHGGFADLSRYPSREGFEDVAMVCSDAKTKLAWSAVTFPEEGWLWISLKDPHVLPSTLLWHSNGGRHYPPWSGRHRAVLGVEEICSFFQEGIAASTVKNSISRRGIPTCQLMSPSKPLKVNSIMAVCEIPKNFDRVAKVEPMAGGIKIASSSQKTAQLSVDLSFLDSR